MIALVFVILNTQRNDICVLVQCQNFPLVNSPARRFKMAAGFKGKFVASFLSRISKINKGSWIKILIQLQTSNFQFLRLIGYIAVILFRRHASHKFQEAISWSITWIFLLLISQVSYVVSDHFRWSYAPVNRKKRLKMCLHFASNSHVAPMFKTRFLRRASVWSLWKLFHPVKQWLKQFLRDHYLHKFRTDKLSTFSKTKPLRSPRLVSLSFFNFNQIWNVATHRKVFAPFLFIAFDDKLLLFLVYSIAAFLSFTSFPPDSHWCHSRVFNKTSILLGLVFFFHCPGVNFISSRKPLTKQCRDLCFLVLSNKCDPVKLKEIICGG